MCLLCEAAAKPKGDGCCRSEKSAEAVVAPVASRLGESESAKGRTRVRAKASKAAVNPDPGRAHGTGPCVVLPQPVQAMRGTSQCSQASNWKKSRWRH